MKRRVLVALPALALTLRNVAWPVEAVVGRVPDDALTYLVIARNVTGGHGFSFDGLEPTTGFHPLWLAVVAALPHGSPEVGFRALLAAYGACVALAAVLLDHVLRRAGVGARHAAIAAAFTGAWAASAYGLGMESGVAVAAVLGVLVAAEGRGALPVAAGALLGLARVDLAPLALAGGWRTTVGAGLGVAATLAGNLVISGEPWSTAAALKGTGGVAWRLARLDPAVVWRHLPGPAAAALAVLGIGAVVGATRARGSRVVGWAAGLAVAQLAASYLFNNLVAPWYHMPLTWLLVAQAHAVSARVRGGGWLAVALVLVCVRGVGLPAPGLHATVLSFAREVDATVPAGSRIVAEDFPGLLAWFSRRTILPADGLAASPAYRPALLGGGALEWWRARGADRYAVTRRRVSWLDERPLVDRIAPPFLPAVPTNVPLDPDAIEVLRVDDASGRVFAAVRLGPRMQEVR